MEEYDYIIVGGGTAGCVLAARLSEDPTARVLMVEAGPSDSNPLVQAPAAFSRLFKTSRDWDLSTEPQVGLNDRRLYWPRGRMLGGCSSINAMMVVRGHPADYDGWAAGGCTGWSFSDVLPYFRRSEDSARGPSEIRGVGGPLTVEEQRSPHPATQAFLDTAAGLGLGRCSDVNGLEPEGVERTQVNQRSGRRWSVVDAYLRPAQRRSNLEVRTNTLARRIVIDDRQATGVVLSDPTADGGEVQLKARREVILAAGTVHSPHLLMMSGIGRGSTLQTLGIPVCHDLPGVGDNLQDHLACGVVVEAVGIHSLRRAERLPAVARWLLTKRGPVTSPVAEACGFVRTGDAAVLPDLELIFAPTAFVDHGLTRIPGDHVSVGGILLQPESRGQILPSSPDPFVAPSIRPNYLSDEDGEDLRVLVSGVRLCRRLLGSEPLSEMTGSAYLPPDSVQSDDEIREFVRQYAESLYHPVGTCRMGSDDRAVVTPGLKLRALAGLRVVDASIMPRIIRGHPHWPVIMIAEKASDLILKDR